MKKIGLIAGGLILFQIMVQAQCEVNYQETLGKYCSGIYLIHHELNNQNAADATLILHEGNIYNIYLLSPSQSFSDFILLADSIDITAEFEIIEEGKAASYQIATENTNEYRFSMLTESDSEVCVLLAIYLQPDLNKDIPAGLYRSFAELKFKNPGHPYTYYYTKKKAGSLFKMDYHYKLNLGRKDRKQIGEVYAFNDGKDTYVNIATLSKGIGPGTLFAKAEDLEDFYYVEYYESAIVPSHLGTIYADSWQKKLINKETGQIMKLNRANLKQIIKDDPELLQEYLLESNKTKKLKNYLVRYLEGAHEDTVAVYEDLFSAEEPLYLTLKFDVSAFKKTKRQDVYHDAEMTNVVSDDLQVTDSVQVKARETIRQKFCNLPPIWLKIGNSGFKTDSLQDLFRMNMLVRCKNAAQYESYVLREYLVYKIYNIISPLSSRVRLIRLSIIDTGKGNEVTEDWAFIQEPDELMALRLNGKMISNDELSMSKVNPEIINSLSMFQYMIGNADYSVTARHKLKILAKNSGNPSGFLPVPYDFDYSGLVNTDYAVPGMALGTTSIRERYYLGPCLPEQVHEQTIQELAQFEDEIMEYIKDFEYLDDKEKTDMIEYLDSYFKESRKSWFIDRKIAPTCR